MVRRSRGRFSRPVAIAAAIGITLALAACGTSSSGSGAQQKPGTLTIAVNTPPATLNPVLGGNGDPLQIFYELAYDPLIYQQPDGSFTPGLATKWGFVGEGNTVFDLTLRSGVKFSDGTDLTAQGVKDFFAYYADKGGFASRFQNFQSVDITGPLSLRITLKEPNPQLPYMLTQDLVSGDVVSPNAIKSPDALGTSTAGAGQYVLDTAKTVSNQTYVYNANPTYWNKSAIKWKTIVVKVLSNTSAALAAMKTGQVDYMFGTAKDADSAKAAGFTVTTQPYLFGFAPLFDRAGVDTPALGDLRVRQALNYAVDRKALAKALFGKYATPSDQLLLPGADGYDSSLNGTYPYDVAKAKKLMAEAGYKSGFTLPMTVFNLQPGETDAAQALATYWNAIGVKTEITVSQTVNDYAGAVVAKKAASTVFEYGGQPMYLVSSELLSTANPFFNPYASTNATITSLLTQGAAASAADSPAIYKKVNAELVKQAWYVPFASIDKIVISRKGLEGIKMTPDSLNPNPVFFSAK